jgi:hypothetical protein
MDDGGIGSCASETPGTARPMIMAISSGELILAFVGTSLIN